MASISLIRLRNAALAAFAPMPGKSPAAVNTYPLLNPFDDIDWQTARNAREFHDRIEHIRRWCITVDPGDGCVREFYLCGTFAQVTARARILFPFPPYSILVEPATAHGGEVFDKRFHVLPIALGS
jgi:hypothetical protein